MTDCDGSPSTTLALKEFSMMRVNNVPGPARAARARTASLRLPLRLALSLLILPVPILAASVTGWIGTYTTQNNADTGSAGIYSFRWDTTSGSFSAVHPVAQTSNPSFLALDPSGHFLYAANEDASASGLDRISAFAIGDPAASAPLKSLGSVSSMGKMPCHLAVDSTGKWLFAANYGSGTITLIPIRSDGSLGEAKQTIQQQGSGPDTDRQGSSHAHEVVESPDGHFLLAMDLGADRIFIYRFDAAAGTLTANDPASAAMPRGYGPRHMVFSKDGKLVYALSELNPSLITLRWNAERGALTQLALTSTLPATFAGKRSGAEIALHPSGKFIYTSNRDDSNTIAIFQIGADGIPVASGWVPSGGKTPRYIGIDPSGHFLIAANQSTGDLYTFRIDPVSGALSLQGAPLHVPAPVDVLFAATRAPGATATHSAP
jgi:6-phosphogluconolactonase